VRSRVGCALLLLSLGDCTSSLEVRRGIHNQEQTSPIFIEAFHVINPGCSPRFAEVVEQPGKTVKHPPSLSVFLGARGW